jgi:hypothetical protein
MNAKTPLTVMNGASEKAVGAFSVAPQADGVNILFEVKGRYPLGCAWRHFQIASSGRAVWNLFEADGITSLRQVASTAGTSTRGQQSSGAPALLLMDGLVAEVEHE